MRLYRTVSDRGLWKKYRGDHVKHFHKPCYLKKDPEPQVTYSQLDLGENYHSYNHRQSTPNVARDVEEANRRLAENSDKTHRPSRWATKSAPSSRAMTPTRNYRRGLVDDVILRNRALSRQSEMANSVAASTLLSPSIDDDRLSFESRSLTAFSNFSNGRDDSASCSDHNNYNGRLGELRSPEADRPNPFVGLEKSNGYGHYLGTSNKFADSVLSNALASHTSSLDYSPSYTRSATLATATLATSTPSASLSSSRQRILQLRKEFLEGKPPTPPTTATPKTNKYLREENRWQPNTTENNEGNMNTMPVVHRAEVVNVRTDSSSSSSSSSSSEDSQVINDADNRKEEQYANTSGNLISNWFKAKSKKAAPLPKEEPKINNNNVKSPVVPEPGSSWTPGRPTDLDELILRRQHEAGLHDVGRVDQAEVEHQPLYENAAVALDTTQEIDVDAVLGLNNNWPRSEPVEMTPEFAQSKKSKKSSPSKFFINFGRNKTSNNDNSDDNNNMGKVVDVVAISRQEDNKSNERSIPIVVENKKNNSKNSLASLLGLKKNNNENNNVGNKKMVDVSHLVHEEDLEQPLYANQKMGPKYIGQLNVREQEELYSNLGNNKGNNRGNNMGNNVDNNVEAPYYEELKQNHRNNRGPQQQEVEPQSEDWDSPQESQPQENYRPLKRPNFFKFSTRPKSEKYASTSDSNEYENVDKNKGRSQSHHNLAAKTSNEDKRALANRTRADSLGRNTNNRRGNRSAPRSSSLSGLFGIRPSTNRSNEGHYETHNEPNNESRNDIRDKHRKRRSRGDSESELRNETKSLPRSNNNNTMRSNNATPRSTLPRSSRSTPKKSGGFFSTKSSRPSPRDIAQRQQEQESIDRSIKDDHSEVDDASFGEIHDDHQERRRPRSRGLAGLFGPSPRSRPASSERPRTSSTTRRPSPTSTTPSSSARPLQVDPSRPTRQMGRRSGRFRRVPPDQLRAQRGEGENEDERAINNRVSSASLVRTESYRAAKGDENLHHSLPRQRRNRANNEMEERRSLGGPNSNNNNNDPCVIM